MSMFGIGSALGDLTAQRQNKKDAMFDGIKTAVEQVAGKIDERMAVALTANTRQAALSVVLQLAMILSEGQDVDPDDELLPNELLDGLMIDAFNDDDDDGIDEMVNTVFSAHIADAFSSLGVSDDTIENIFGDDLDVADTAIESACDTVLENLPDDGKPLDDFINEFVYGDYSDDEEIGDDAYDGVMFDKAGKKLSVGKKTIKKVNGHTIAYKAIKAVRHGKVVTINKRMSGHIILNSKQKGALRKARAKANTAGAIRKQMRSLSKGIKRGIYKLTSGQAKALQNASLRRHNKAAFK